MKIVAVILTKNEARHIADCIRSVRWADLVVVEDTYSEDSTPDIAAAEGALVFQQAFINFAAARNTALARARDLGATWVLFVDADERVTPELAAEIRQAVHRPEYVGWWIPRYNVMWGHTMRGGGWYPDYQLRLMRVDMAHYDPERQVHEVVILDGAAGYLQEHLIHYNYDSLAQFRAKQNRYIDFEARILKEKGIRAKPWTYITMPLRELHRRYIRLKGYQDGWVGLQLCGLMAWYTFLTYLRLARLHRQT
ncbi:MAG: glycosyltransferase family 2 protein [Chloroflexi bacterium]|nr:MAG: glycosyltransferase family 2 protein [Chloroflexota bacterium]